MKNYWEIKTYEDACSSLGIDPIVDFGNDEVDEIAYKKLKTISRALWGKNFEPKPEAEGKEVYWWPWFALYTQKEINEMSEGKRGSLLSAYALGGATAGFGFLTTINRSSHSVAHFGFRLCQETQEKAQYFGMQFIRLWADYTLLNFRI